MNWVIFKPKFRVWLFRGIVPLGLTAYIVYMGGMDTQYGTILIVIGFILAGWVLMANILPLWNLKFAFSDEGILGHQLQMYFMFPIFHEDEKIWEKYLFNNLPKFVRGHSFRFLYRDITAIWMERGRYYRPSLYIATDYVTAEIPLPWFDRKRIWKEITKRFTEGELTDEARKNAFVRRAWKDHNTALLEDFKESIKVRIKQRMFIVALLVGLALGWVLVIAVSEKLLWAILFFGIPEITIVRYIYRWPRYLILDREKLELKTYFGSYELRWEDIQSVQIDGSFYQFYIGKKQIWIPHGHAWMDVDIKAVDKIIRAQISVQEIEKK